jgi:hypothetical protein
MNDSLTGMSRDEVQMLGADAFLSGELLSDNPYQVSKYDIPTGDVHGMRKAIKIAWNTWKMGYLAMKSETELQKARKTT